MDPININSLNKDVHEYILDKLDPPSRAALGATSKKMAARHKDWIKRQEALQDYLNGNFSQVKENFASIQRCFETGATQYPNATRLILDTGDPFEGWEEILEDQHLNALVGRTLKLKEFGLVVQDPRKIKVSSEQIKALLENCPEMEKLSLPEKIVNDAITTYCREHRISLGITAC